MSDPLEHVPYPEAPGLMARVAELERQVAAMQRAFGLGHSWVTPYPYTHAHPVSCICPSCQARWGDSAGRYVDEPDRVASA